MLVRLKRRATVAQPIRVVALRIPSSCCYQERWPACIIRATSLMQHRAPGCLQSRDPMYRLCPFTVEEYSFMNLNVRGTDSAVSSVTLWRRTCLGWRTLSDTAGGRGQPTGNQRPFSCLQFPEGLRHSARRSRNAQLAGSSPEPIPLCHQLAPALTRCFTASCWSCDAGLHQKSACLVQVEHVRSRGLAENTAFMLSSKDRFPTNTATM